VSCSFSVSVKGLEAHAPRISEALRCDGPTVILFPGPESESYTVGEAIARAMHARGATRTSGPPSGITSPAVGAEASAPPSGIARASGVPSGITPAVNVGLTRGGDGGGGGDGGEGGGGGDGGGGEGGGGDGGGGDGGGGDGGGGEGGGGDGGGGDGGGGDGGGGDRLTRLRGLTRGGGDGGGGGGGGAVATPEAIPEGGGAISLTVIVPDGSWEQTRALVHTFWRRAPMGEEILLIDSPEFLVND